MHVIAREEGRKELASYCGSVFLYYSWDREIRDNFLLSFLSPFLLLPKVHVMLAREKEIAIAVLFSCITVGIVK